MLRDPVTCGVRWSSYRLSSHVLLAFWAFAGVVMATERGPPPRRRRGGLGEGEGREGTGLGAARRPRPSGASPLVPAGPHPAPPSAQPPQRRARVRLPGRVCWVRSRCSDSSSRRRRRRRRQGPGTGARRHFRRPLRSAPPAAETSPHSRPGWDATWAPWPPPPGGAAPRRRPASRSLTTWGRAPAAGPPRRAPARPPVPARRPRASAPEGGAWLAEIPGGTGGGGRRAASPTPRPPAALGPAPSRTTSRSPARFREQSCEDPAARPSGPGKALGPEGPGPPPPGPRSALRGGSPRPSDLLAPRGLGAAARDVQTQLSAEPETRELRLDNQEPRPVRGGGARERHAEAGHTGGGPVGAGCARVRGPECLEWDAGRGPRQDLAVKEGAREESGEEGAERSPLRAGGEGHRGKETVMGVPSPPA